MDKVTMRHSLKTGEVSRRWFAAGMGAALAAVIGFPRAARAGWPVQSSYASREPDGTFIRKPGRAMALYQRVAIVFDDGVETMTLRSLYTGTGDLFGCFGPIGGDSKSRPGSEKVFTDLDRATGRRAFASVAGSEAHRAAPRVDIHNLELLRTMDEIRLWFDRNGFEMTKKKHDVFLDYFEAERIFFAALLAYDRYRPGTTVNLWTPPVENIFSSDNVWYPVKSTTVGDGTHSFICLDVLTRGRLAKLPDFYKLQYQGQHVAQGKKFSLARFEAQLTFDQMAHDLNIEVE